MEGVEVMRRIICIDDKKGSISLPLINGREYLEKSTFTIDGDKYSQIYDKEGKFHIGNFASKRFKSMEDNKK